MGGFSWPVRVYWEDTDGGGIVYHASYLRFMERARTEWLRARGYAQTVLSVEPGIVFAVTRMEIDFRRPARLDDALQVTCTLMERGAASILFTQTIHREGAPAELLLEAQVRVACVDARRLKPRRIPEEMAKALDCA